MFRPYFRLACWHCKATSGSRGSAFSFASPPAFAPQNINPHLKEESMSAAPNVNTVTLVGQPTTDPVLRGMSDGRNVCDLRLAVNDQRDQSPLRGSGRNQVPAGEGYTWAEQGKWLRE
jgi:hypothetical protein